MICLLRKEYKLDKEKIKILANIKTIKSENELNKEKVPVREYAAPRYLKIKPLPMLKQSELNNARIDLLLENFIDRLNRCKDIKKFINSIFLEMLETAYLDRIIAYNLEAKSKSIDLDLVQSIRQKSDNHLIQIIKAYMEFEKPNIKVSVRKLEQMNVAEKQVNIKTEATSNLDKNEKIN